MKTILPTLLLLLLTLPAFGQPVDSLPTAPSLPTNYIFLVENPGIRTYKSTIGTLINALVAGGVGTNISFSTNLFITGSNTVAAGLNTTVVTNITASNVTFTISSSGSTQMVAAAVGVLTVTNHTLLGGGATFDGGADFNDEAVFNAAVIIADVTASRIAALHSDKTLTNAVTTTALLDNFFAMGISNVLAGPGIALATNNGVLWITNTGVTSANLTNLDVHTTLELFGTQFISTNLWVTGTVSAASLSVVSFYANDMTLTNAMGSNQVRLGYQDLTNVLRRQTIYVDAGAMISNATAGATFFTEETSPPTNRMSDSFLFSGTVTNIVQFRVGMPENWNLSTVKVKLWTTSTNNIATTTNVWSISAAAVKQNSVITNIDWGTELTITNTVSSTGGFALLTPATPALTVGNTPVAAGQLVWFRISRLPGHADDNDGGIQKLLAAWIQYGETMSEVASW